MRIVMIKGAVETLEYFSGELKDAFLKMEDEVWFWDMKHPADSRDEFLRLSGERRFDCLITFNFIGLSGESQFEGLDGDIWDENKMKTVCIMVDHPLYYYDQLKNPRKDCRLLCIDREHVRFINDNYKDAWVADFMPLAGNVGERLVPMKARRPEVAFAGSYVRDEDLDKYAAALPCEVRALYEDMIDDLKADPSTSLDDIMERVIKRELGEISIEEKLACVHQMMYVDLKIRSYFRRKIVTELAKSGICMRVVGGGWDSTEIKDYSNVTLLGLRDTRTCLDIIANSSMSLNMLPWFKDGAHDRIFSSMLLGSVVVSDTSKYIRECVPMDCAIFYDLENIDSLPGMVAKALSDKEMLDDMANKAYNYASNNHTWANRAKQIRGLVE